MKRSEIDVTPLRQSNSPIIFVLGKILDSKSITDYFNESSQNIFEVRWMHV